MVYMFIINRIKFDTYVNMLPHIYQYLACEFDTARLHVTYVLDVCIIGAHQRTCYR